MTVTQVLAVAGDIDATTENGMCFGVNPTVVGVYCHWFAGDGTTADAVNTHGINWLSADQWNAFDGTYGGNSIGLPLTSSSNGLVLVPDVESTLASGGMALGATLTAAFYQPKEENCYYAEATEIVLCESVYVKRLSAEQTATSFGINPVTNALTSCGDGALLLNAISLATSGAAMMMSVMLN